MSEECNKVCRELMTKDRLYERLNAALKRSEISIARGEAEYDTLMEVKRFLDQYFNDLNLKANEPEKESIPYLMHKEMGVPISDCKDAYDFAIRYLRNKTKVKADTGRYTDSEIKEIMEAIK